jgi:predicted aspartyl protease
MNGSLRFLILGLSSLALLMSGVGCRTSAPVWAPEPVDIAPLPVVAKTTIKTRIELPMNFVGGLVVVETQGADGPWRFLIDTGSSTCLVSPEYAIRHLRKPVDPTSPKVWLRDASGRAAAAESVLLSRIDFGYANFQNVRALVFDCREISDHLGMQIDGVLGFSLFGNARLTLDYPNRKVIMSSLNDETPLRGSILPVTSHNDVPLIQITLDNRNLVALIDTGNDGGLTLDPAGLNLDFASPPRRGTLVGTLYGDHEQFAARLAHTVHLSDHKLVNPIVDLSGTLTSLGGEILKEFEVTFDQSRNLVAFYRPLHDMLLFTPPKLSSGLSFKKFLAYWKVTGIAPDSPAEAAGLAVGDLVIRINDEPVEGWTLSRFRALIDDGGTINYTLIKGQDELTHSVKIFTLVP